MNRIIRNLNAVFKMQFDRGKVGAFFDFKPWNHSHIWLMEITWQIWSKRFLCRFYVEFLQFNNVYNGEGCNIELAFLGQILIYVV